VSDIDDLRQPLSVDDVSERIRAVDLDWPVPVLMAQVGSTNDEVTALAAGGAPEGTCVVAEEQTAGRGRLDRTWVSPPGAGLWASVLIRPADVPKARWGLLSLAAGLAAADALAAGCRVRAELKWPNDVVVVNAACGGDGGLKKIGGILASAASDDVIVLGIGINVSLRGDELPIPMASSVLLEAGTPDRAALLVELLRALQVRVGQWRSGDPAMLADYRRLCCTIGRPVDVQLPSGATVVGVVSGVDDDGHLLVSDGEVTQRVTAGDVVHATI
jgi:BirA family biotin operon repressor/biotin-[acetyl-CoA-carboxylase] ligase